MLNYLLRRGAAQDESAPAEKKEIVVGLVLGAPVWCAGDLVRGTVEVEHFTGYVRGHYSKTADYNPHIPKPKPKPKPQEPKSEQAGSGGGGGVGGGAAADTTATTTTSSTKIDAATFLDCRLELRFHGHMRVEPRWLQLPRPIRKIFGQMDNTGGSSSSPSGGGGGGNVGSIMPDFPEFQGDNVACIFTTPPVVIAEGLNIEDILVAKEGEPERPMWKRAFAVALPAVMMPSFKGYGGKIFYMASLTVRNGTLTGADPKAPRGLLGRGNPAAQRLINSGLKITNDIHLPFTVLSMGWGGASAPTPTPTPPPLEPSDPLDPMEPLDPGAPAYGPASPSSSPRGGAGKRHPSGPIVKFSRVFLAPPCVDLPHLPLPNPDGTLNSQNYTSIPSITVDKLDLLNVYGEDTGEGPHNPTVFTIRNGAGPDVAVRVQLQKTEYTVGDHIMVTLDFEHPCRYYYPSKRRDGAAKDGAEREETRKEAGAAAAEEEEEEELQAGGGGGAEAADEYEDEDEDEYGDEDDSDYYEDEDEEEDDGDGDYIYGRGSDDDDSWYDIGQNAGDEYFDDEFADPSDIRDGGNLCCQVAVALVTKESSPRAEQDGKSPRGGGGGGAQSASSSSMRSGYETVVDTKLCFTQHMVTTTLILAIPIDANVSFRSAMDFVQLEWFLKFEFAMAVPRKAPEVPAPPSPNSSPLPRPPHTPSDAPTSSSSRSVSPPLPLPPVTLGPLSLTPMDAPPNIPIGPRPSPFDAAATAADVDNPQPKFEVLRWNTPIKVLPPPHGRHGFDETEYDFNAAAPFRGAQRKWVKNAPAGEEDDPNLRFFTYYESAQNHTKITRINVPIVKRELPEPEPDAAAPAEGSAPAPPYHRPDWNKILAAWNEAREKEREAEAERPSEGEGEGESADSEREERWMAAADKWADEVFSS